MDLAKEISSDLRSKYKKRRPAHVLENRSKGIEQQEIVKRKAAIHGRSVEDVSSRKKGYDLRRKSRS